MNAFSICNDLFLQKLKRGPTKTFLSKKTTSPNDGDGEILGFDNIFGRGHTRPATNKAYSYTQTISSPRNSNLHVEILFEMKNRDLLNPRFIESGKAELFVEGPNSDGQKIILSFSRSIYPSLAPSAIKFDEYTTNVLINDKIHTIRVHVKYMDQRRYGRYGSHETAQWKISESKDAIRFFIE